MANKGIIVACFAYKDHMLNLRKKQLKFATNYS